MRKNIGKNRQSLLKDSQQDRLAGRPARGKKSSQIFSQTGGAVLLFHRQMAAARRRFTDRNRKHVFMECVCAVQAPRISL
jgi:hypothetical protein